MEAPRKLQSAQANCVITWSGPAALATPSAGLDQATAIVLLDRMSDYVWLVDMEGRFRYTNDEFLKLVGLRREEVLGRSYRWVFGDQARIDFEHVSHLLAQGSEVHVEGWTHYRSTRGPVYLQQTLLPLSRPGEAIHAIAVFSRDLTSLKKRETELAERVRELQTSEALKSSVFDNALAGLITTDADGRIVEFNPAAEAMFGHERSQVLGRAVGEVVIPPRHREAHQAGIARMKAGGEARLLGRRLQLEALRADGSEFPIEMALWRTSIGDVAFYTASIVDITERRRTAQQIEEQREALRMSEKLTTMGGLLAGVAHELNNPLAIAMGRASMLEEKYEDPALREDVRRIREATERCGRIVRTFLDMARGHSFRRDVVNLNDIVRASLGMLQYTLRTHGVEVTLRLADRLPAISADSDQVSQIVVNLLIYAQQALDGAVGPREITLRTGHDAGSSDQPAQVWLQMSDSGPGIPEDQRGSIFEPYVTSKGDLWGAGLGLPVSRSLARGHGGDLCLVDDAGHSGASFRLTLPADMEEAHAGEPTSLQDEPPPAASPRVLVVDDEPEIADLVRDMLEGHRFDVTTAESAAVALEMLQMTEFDVAIFDFRMPEMDGSQLWLKMSTMDPQLAARTLFLTGDTLAPNAREFLKRSARPVLDKPFSKAELVRAVERLLQQEVSLPSEMALRGN